LVLAARHSGEVSQNSCRLFRAVVNRWGLVVNRWPPLAIERPADSFYDHFFAHFKHRAMPLGHQRLLANRALQRRGVTVPRSYRCCCSSGRQRRASAVICCCRLGLGRGLRLELRLGMGLRLRLHPR
jgi:hypothetical protein